MAVDLGGAARPAMEAFGEETPSSLGSLGLYAPGPGVPAAGLLDVLPLSEYLGEDSRGLGS